MLNENDFYDFDYYEAVYKAKAHKTFGFRTILLTGILCFVTGVLLTMGVGYVQALLLSMQPTYTSQGMPNTQIIPQKPTPKPTPLPTPAPTQRALPPLGRPQSGYIENPGNRIKSIVNYVVPSVVGITIKQTIDVGMEGEPTTKVETAVGRGSGMVLTPDGYIVTNNHVVENEDIIYVTIDEKEYPATVMGIDPYFDVAVIKIDVQGLTPITIGNSQTLEIGEGAVAIGYPNDIDSATATAGIISAPKRVTQVDSGASIPMIQTDAHINPGNSGGALVNYEGEVVGMNIMRTIYAGMDEYGMPIPAEAVSFALPINEVIEISKSLIQYASMPRPAIGITASEIDEEFARIYKTQPGIIIASVTPGGSAARAGLQVEDIILQINGAVPGKLEDFVKRISSAKVGDVIELLVDREGKQLTITVTVGDMNQMNFDALNETVQE